MKLSDNLMIITPILATILFLVLFIISQNTIFLIATVISLIILSLLIAIILIVSIWFGMVLYYSLMEAYDEISERGKHN